MPSSPQFCCDMAAPRSGEVMAQNATPVHSIYLARSPGAVDQIPKLPVLDGRALGVGGHVAAQPILRLYRGLCTAREVIARVPVRRAHHIPAALLMLPSELCRCASR